MKSSLIGLVYVVVLTALTFTSVKSIRILQEEVATTAPAPMPATAAAPKPTTTTTSKGATFTTTYTKTTNPTTNSVSITNSGTTSNTIDNGANGERLDLGQQIFGQINAYRSSQGLKQLTWSTQAYNFAMNQSQDQANKNTSSNSGFSGRAQSFNYYYENVGSFTNGKAANIPTSIVNLWKSSGATNSNMLNTMVTQGAVSVNYKKSTNTFYATMINVKP